MRADRNLTVYRAYAAADRLLYVGVSSNPVNRIGTHNIVAAWWLEAVRVDLEHLPAGTTLAEAEEAERLAIIAGRPVYNVRHNRHDVDRLPQRLHPLTVLDNSAEASLQEAADLFGCSLHSLRTRVCVHRLIPSVRGDDGVIRVRLADVQRLALAVVA